ncbi:MULTISPECIES: redox-sensing transcriptional repressor Rex [Latilactobacillus]|uniref:Redox-sensing transcriptional repressor Rex n=2 Tax=Latilactobacillus curvatus TaxID=28038 RepID=A0A0B2XNL3_LATCU|nr:redox-sensing transcriptional repressor Rex [Latilactobacillus curvatus]ANJ68821.1 redox-sensing transcriptional repressor Rex [Latilactobacillus curvatus]AOO76062.1 redox-sensing transcriptional repressor Rex [Latilactobacillus curvatus]AWV73526.1 redox-sensing transcriptional repressor Rex [Latilactobacillus curvatus]EHE86819.1 redox-sensing transcriptional repressor Rex [Latilactobacillus curvatus CRL 705]KHO13539.1 redox-sensing transcriptional repressor Rex [Latilactobacillus curvatus]
MVENNIPRATAKRLPLYYRYLNFLNNSGKTKISSTGLSEAVKVDSATIRRDFSYFGALGKRGYGYDVASLLDFFKKTLNQDRLTNVALIGVGNLGHALLNYNFKQTNNIRISAAFDVKPEMIGTIQTGVPVYSMDEMAEQLKNQQIEIVILTVPIDEAQEVTDELVAAGIKGIMNFTPIRISVPSNVRIQNVDLAKELQTLIYFLDNYTDEQNQE